MSKVWRYGDHVDTDVIIPARYLNIADIEELKTHAMEDSKEDAEYEFAKNVRRGDIIVGGKNFGCGSSREAAPLVLKANGIRCVIADSFARIFYRNAISIGLPLVEIGKDVEQIGIHEVLFVDLPNGIVRIANKGIDIKIRPIPDFVQKISDAGGLINYVKETGKL